MLILFILSLLVIAGLGYVYFRARNRVLQFTESTTAHANQIQLLQKNEEELKKQVMTFKMQLDHAIKDPVTGLLGWQIFEDRFNLAIKESERFNFTMGLLIVDIDDFRLINDALGHETGDYLLKQVSLRLQENIRQVDSASRINKDRFIILLTQITKPETAALIAQRMLQSFEKPFNLETHQLYLTASIGIAIYPNDGSDSGTLMKCASEALQIAKEKDKHGFHFYQENIHTNSKRELAIYAGLKQEALYDELKIYFQPIINTNDESIFCMDVLLHWQLNANELIQPNELFLHAEKQHVLNVISEWLLRKACEQFMKWQSLSFRPQCLGFPVTMKQLENSAFIYRMSEIMKELDFSPKWLLLEIKDNTAFSIDTELKKSFNMLEYLKIKLAFENFGNGFFSLKLLKQFPVNYLKLDKELTENMTVESTEVIAIVKGLLVLAAGLNAELIIQDVSTAAQLKLLKELGCSLMQGQFLAEPVAQEEVEKKMTSA